MHDTNDLKQREFTKRAEPSSLPSELACLSGCNNGLSSFSQGNVHPALALKSFPTVPPGEPLHPTAPISGPRLHECSHDFFVSPIGSGHERGLILLTVTVTVAADARCRCAYTGNGLGGIY